MIADFWELSEFTVSEKLICLNTNLLNVNDITNAPQSSVIDLVPYCVVTNNPKFSHLGKLHDTCLSCFEICPGAESEYMNQVHMVSRFGLHGQFDGGIWPLIR